MSNQKPTYIISAIVLFILSFLLNPSADRHREKISQSISERSQLENALGVGHVAAFAAKYKSIGIASYTTINDNIYSVGILGIVIFID